MNLPKFSLAHKPIVFGFAILLLAWGLNTFFEAPRREDPQFIIREAVVITDWPGATAEQVEQFITNKVEKAAWKIWVDTAGLPKANQKQVSHILEDVDYQEGDGFSAEIRHPVPEAERGDYREFSGAGGG